MLHKHPGTLLLVAATLASCSESSPPAATETAPQRLAVGQKAPPFTLKDQNGHDQSLEELLVKGKVALVFFRSADW